MSYVKQLLSGRDYALVNPAAGQMANFSYLVGDREAGECCIVDPSWDVRGLLQIAEEEGLKVIGGIATHGHQDHVGGRIFGMEIEGVGKLVELAGVTIYVHDLDAASVLRNGQLQESDIVRVQGGDTLKVGAEELTFIHTPGHSPGGICVRTGDAVITGDTLFVGACGRVDLPDSDPDKMWESLNQTLASLPDDLVVYPGHDYGMAPRSTIADEKRTNPYMQIKTLAEWRAMA